MARASNLTMCSFCGKSHAEVRKLIAGPGVYICDSCINVCKSILDKELNEDARRQSSTIRVPKPAEIGIRSTNMSSARTSRKRRFPWRSIIISSVSCKAHRRLTHPRPSSPILC